MGTIELERIGAPRDGAILYLGFTLNRPKHTAEVGIDSKFGNGASGGERGGRRGGAGRGGKVGMPAPTVRTGRDTSMSWLYAAKNK